MSLFQAARMPWENLSFLHKLADSLTANTLESPLTGRFVLIMCDLPRKSLQSWHGPNSRIRLKLHLNPPEIHHRFPPNREPRFPCKSHRFQRFPTTQVPSCKTVSVKVPRSFAISPRLDISLDAIPQNRLHKIPIPIVIHTMRHKPCAFQLFYGRFRFDRDQDRKSVV